MLLIGGLSAICGQRNGINYMASKHTAIMYQVIIDWSVNRRGRLYMMQQGTFRALYSDAIIRISPYPKKQKGYPDLVGFEYDTRYIKPVPVYTLIEIKTKGDRVKPEQQNHLNYCISIGGRAYVAMEDNSPEGYSLTEWVAV